MTAARTSVDNATSAAHALGTATDSQAMLSAVGAQIQPGAEKALDYNRHLVQIGDEICAEFSKAADAQVAASREKLQALIAEAERNAPPGSESAIAAMKSIIGNADASYDQVVRSARQAVEVLRDNLASGGERFVRAAGEAAKGGNK
jgi:phasin family protein